MGDGRSADDYLLDTVRGTLRLAQTGRRRMGDDGLPDAGLVSSFHLPGYGSYAVGQSFVHPDFSGFGNPSVHDDLALLRLDATLPAGLSYPDFGSFIGAGEEVFLVGFGRSGFGDYGYTTDSSLTDRRFGENVIDQLALDDEGSGAPEVFRYDFDSPDLTGQPNGSLGNARDYLSLPNTLCVGGSWVAPGELVLAGDWEGITALAREAAALPVS